MTDPPQIYNKLVRDLIPEIIAQSGKFSSSKILDSAAFQEALQLKVLEEAHDPSDYSSLRWTSRDYLDSELDALLMRDSRAKIAFNNLLKFLPSSGK